MHCLEDQWLCPWSTETCGIIHDLLLSALVTSAPIVNGLSSFYEKIDTEEESERSKEYDKSALRIVDSEDRESEIESCLDNTSQDGDETSQDDLCPDERDLEQGRPLLVVTDETTVVQERTCDEISTQSTRNHDGVEAFSSEPDRDPGDTQGASRSMVASGTEDQECNSARDLYYGEGARPKTTSSERLNHVGAKAPRVVARLVRFNSQEPPSPEETVLDGNCEENDSASSSRGKSSGSNDVLALNEAASPNYPLKRNPGSWSNVSESPELVEVSVSHPLSYPEIENNDQSYSSPDTPRPRGAPAPNQLLAPPPPAATDLPSPTTHDSSLVHHNQKLPQLHENGNGHLSDPSAEIDGPERPRLRPRSPLGESRNFEVAGAEDLADEDSPWANGPRQPLNSQIFKMIRRGGQGGSAKVQSCLQEMGIYHQRIRRPEYAQREARVRSFESWPEGHHLDTEVAVDAGLFYMGYGDATMCFYCGGRLFRWVEGDNPFVEHAVAYPHCSFLRQRLGQPFLDIVKEERNRGVKQVSFQHVCDILAESERGVQVPMLAESDLMRRLADDPAVKSLLEEGGDLQGTYTQDDVLEAARRMYLAGRTLSSVDLLKEIFTVSVENQGEVTCPDPPTEERDAISDMLDRNMSMRNDMLCKVCLTNDLQVIFLPCGHLATCAQCALAMQTCPVCRGCVRASVHANLQRN